MIQVINVGATANDGLGDKLRNAMIIVNSNFASLQSILDTCITDDDIIPISQIDGLQSILDSIQTELLNIPQIQSDINSINTTIFDINNTLNAQNTSITILFQNIVDLQNQINVLVGEAPIDGQSYVRKNASWEIITTMTGATGATGPQGIQGPIGPTGPAPDTSIFVPYTGAINNIQLGTYSLTSTSYNFTGLTNSGQMIWNDQDGTIDLLMKGGNVTLQVGQEQLVRVVNKTSPLITLLESNYQAVRITGAQGQRLKVDLAQATSDTLSAETIGLVTETILGNQEGFVTTSGLVRKINTTGSLQGETWLDGDILYLSPTTAGHITNIKPVAPQHMIVIGYVVSAHITQGSIFVKVNNGYEIDELHNVKISGATNSQVLTYQNGLWINGTASGGSTWGTISGTLSNQTDLQTALNSKQDTLTAVNFGSFMDLQLPTKLTPMSGDFLAARDFLTNEAVEIPFSTVIPTWGNISGTVSNQSDLISLFDEYFYDRNIKMTLFYFLPNNFLATYTTWRVSTSQPLATGGTLVASGNIRTPRLLYQTTSTAGTLAFQRGAPWYLTFQVGVDVLFKYDRKFNIVANVANSRFFAGLSAQYQTSNPTNLEPTAVSLSIGVAKIAASTNLYMMWSTADNTDLGTGFPANDGDNSIYRLTIERLVASTNSMRMTLWRYNATTGQTTSVTQTRNIADPGGPMSPTIWATNNTTASVMSFRDHGCLTEIKNNVTFI